MNVDFNVLVGKTLTNIISDDHCSKEVIFVCDDDSLYIQIHHQDCCEDVSIEDICGTLDDLIGVPILLAEESSNKDNPKSKYDESFTWTFYKLATVKGYVTIRWYGNSNGWYSESVDFSKIEGANK